MFSIFINKVNYNVLKTQAKKRSKTIQKPRVKGSYLREIQNLFKFSKCLQIFKASSIKF